MAGKNAPTFFITFLAISELEVQLEIAATVFWQTTVGTADAHRKFDNDMFLTQREQILEATNWNKMPEKAGAVHRELQDLGIK